MQEPPLDEIDLLAGEALARFEEGGMSALGSFMDEHPDRAHELRQALEGLMLFEHAVGATTKLVSDVADLLDVGASSGLAPGAQIGDFVIQGELGRGGMGIVYRARQRRLQRDVALKILPPEFTASPDRVKRFIREARTCARLSHPCVVTVYDAGLDDGICYLAMELVEGETLSRVFDQGLLTHGWAVEIGRQVADALAAAHDAGLLHRDVKPGNIMLSGATMKLMDFGLVLDRTEGAATLTRSGVVLGTPAYMSPEQIHSGGRELDGRSDVYSLGVVLYEGLTGQLPYASEHSGAMLREIRERPPLPPLRRGHRLPRDLETILMRCLEKRPEQRYESAAALRDDLERYSRGEPIRARPIPLPVRAYRWIESHPVRTTAALGLAAVVIVATYLVTRLDAGETIRHYEARLAAATDRITGLESDLEERDRQVAMVESERDHVQLQIDSIARQRAEEIKRQSDALADESVIDRTIAVRDMERQLGEVALALRTGQADEAERILAECAGRIEALADGRLTSSHARLMQDLSGLVGEVQPGPRDEPSLEAAPEDDSSSAQEVARTAVAVARSASADREYGRAAEQLASAMARIESRSPELGGWQRQLDITEAAAAVMDAARAYLAGAAGERVELASRTGSAMAGVLEELEDDAFWLGLEAGGRVRLQLRAIDSSSLLAWAGDGVSVEERLGFLLAEGEHEAALVLAKVGNSPGELAQHVLDEQAARAAAPFAGSFPGAALSVRDNELEIRWDFEDGKAPQLLELAGNWQIDSGHLRSRDDIVLVTPLRTARAATLLLELDRPTRLAASMGGTALMAYGDEYDPVLLVLSNDRLEWGNSSVPVISDRLELSPASIRGRPAAAGLVLDAVILNLVVTPEWKAAMRGPRRTLAVWRFTAGDPAWAQATIDTDPRAPTGGKVMVARSQEESRPERPPHRRGGRPPPPRPAGQVLEISAPIDQELGAGVRIDIDFALDARERPRRLNLVLIGEGGTELAVIGLEPVATDVWIRRTIVLDEETGEPGLLVGRRLQSIAIRCATQGEPLELRVADLVITCLAETLR